MWSGSLRWGLAQFDQINRGAIGVQCAGAGYEGRGTEAGLVACGDIWEEVLGG